MADGETEEKRILIWIKRSLGLLIAAALFFSVAFAEDPSAEGANYAEVMQEGPAFPSVIDRWNDPEAYPDFAFPEDAKLLEIWFPQLHDADAAVLMYEGETWMIDCADDEKMGSRVGILLNLLQPSTIGRVINTHPHHDHLNGLKIVAEYADVQELDICFPKDSTETMIKAVAYAEKNDIPIVEYGDEDEFLMGDGAVRLHVWMKTDKNEEMNEQSAQIRLTYGERSILFMADMERTGQRQLLEAVGAEALKTDIIKYPHHGKSAMSTPFFEAVQPELVVMLNALHVNAVKESERFLRMNGNPPVVYSVRPMIHLVTDGTTWLCERVHSELTVK